MHRGTYDIILLYYLKTHYSDSKQQHLINTFHIFEGESNASFLLYAAPQPTPTLSHELVFSLIISSLKALTLMIAIKCQLSNYNVPLMKASDTQSVRWCLQVVFLYYASYADRNNCRLLKSQNYRRFLIDCEAVSTQSAFAPFDIAFRKVHPSAVTLAQFQELIPAIAGLVHPSKQRAKAFQMFMAHNMTRLFAEIVEKSEFGADVATLENIRFEGESMELLESAPLRKAYSKYIETTAMHQKEPEQTFEQVYCLLNEFDLSPKLIYKSMAYLSFLMLLRQAPHPHKYHLTQLKQLLICVAELNWRRTHSTHADQSQKILRVLQQMQVSAGFQKMVDKSLKENNMLVSFFRTNQGGLAGSFELDELNASLGVSNTLADYSSRKSTRGKETARMREALKNSEDGDGVVRMKELFGRLCSHGQVGNSKTLKSIKIKRFFSSQKILAELAHDPWLDLTITELTRSSTTGKVEFPEWLQLIRLTADRLNLDHKGLTQYLIDSSAQDTLFHSRMEADKTINRSLAEAESVLWEVEKPLTKIFKNFSKSSNKLTFEQLSHLLYQFDVFPGLISKAKAYSFFEQCTSNDGRIGSLVEKVGIDFKGFIRLLAQIAGQAGESLTQLQRVLFLLEKMQDSEGHRRLLGRIGSNLIGDLRSKYSSVYLSCSPVPQPPQDFESLLSEYASHS